MSTYGLFDTLSMTAERKSGGDNPDEMDFAHGKILGLCSVDRLGLKILCLLLLSNVPRGIKNTGVGKDQLIDAFESKFGERFDWEVATASIPKLINLKVELSSEIGERFQRQGHKPDSDGRWPLLDGTKLTDMSVVFQVSDFAMITLTHELKKPQS